MEEIKHDGGMTAREMQKKGGQALKEKYGADYYKQLGAKAKAKVPPGHYQRISKLAAEARRKKKEAEDLAKASAYEGNN